jgi:hypothetical protein
MRLVIGNVSENSSPESDYCRSQGIRIYIRARKAVLRGLTEGGRQNRPGKGESDPLLLHFAKKKAAQKGVERLSS